MAHETSKDDATRARRADALIARFLHARDERA